MKKMHSMAEIGDYGMRCQNQIFDFGLAWSPRFFFVEVSKLPTVHIRSTVSLTAFTYLDPANKRL